MPKSLQLLFRDARASVEEVVLDALNERGYPLTPGQQQIMRNLGEDGARPSELAALAGVTRQAVTKVIDELERQGYVRRDPDPDDGRGVVVRYTEEGLGAMRFARASLRRLEREFAAEVGAERWATFREVLETLFDTPAGQSASRVQRS
jgi:DNA-binding MarR family transcriptional regulator